MLAATATRVPHRKLRIGGKRVRIVRHDRNDKSPKMTPTPAEKDK
jgi:hypothetical protein